MCGHIPITKFLETKAYKLPKPSEMSANYPHSFYEWFGRPKEDAATISYWQALVAAS